MSPGVLRPRVQDFKTAANQLFLTGQAAAAYFGAQPSAQKMTLAIVDRLRSELGQLPKLPVSFESRLAHLLFCDETSQPKADLDLILSLKTELGPIAPFGRA